MVSPSPAVLVVDSQGRVRSASAGACRLWRTTTAELAGQPLAALFLLSGGGSHDPDAPRLLWETIRATAQGLAATLEAQFKDGTTAPVLVRLEEMDEAAWVFVQPAVVAEAGIPPAEFFFRQLNERSPLGFFDLNFLKNEVYYSPTCKRLLGYADAELPNTYDSWLKLLHPEDSAAAPDRQSRVSASGSRTFSNEFRMRHAQGHYVWIQCVGIRHHGPNGALQRVMGANLDITDRKEFEEAGLRADERLQQFGERGRAGLFDLDFATGNFWLSPGFKSMLGFADGELANTPESMLRSLPMDETAGGLQSYFLARQPDQLAYFEVIRLRHRDARDVPAHACIVRQISRHRELQRVLGFVVPMLESESSAARELGFPAAHVAAVLAELQEGVLLADANGKIVHLNAKAERILHRPLEQSIGLDSGEVFRLVHGQNGQPGENPVTRALNTAEAAPLNSEFVLEIVAVGTQPVVFSARPVVDASGRAIGAVIVFRNPTEMNLTPEELVRANRFETLGQLAGGIAHDFNNLLTTILGGVSVARESRDFSALENSERACLAAKGLSKQLLTFAKGGAATRQVVRTADILNDSVRLAASGSTVQVEIQVAPDTATICVDRAQILQVFQNLIVNAIQAMPTGSGHIWLTATNTTLAPAQVSGLTGGIYVAVELKDNGSGIKPEHLERIFDPFFTTKKTGTGLGLATVLSIVKRHGGQIGVVSDVGVGTTFTVFLPVAEQPEEVEARRAPAFNIATRTRRILVMDDDRAICTVTQSMLEALDYKCDLAFTGEEAIQFYKRYLNIGRPYDLVVMDLTIVGGMGGEQCFKILRDLHPEIRAIIASGYDNDDMARQYLDMGFCGYLTKPYRMSDLGRIIKKVLGG